MIDLIVFIVLLLLGFVIGNYLEKRHFKSIKERETEFINLPTIMLKNPLRPEGIKSYDLVSGNVVISIDYFKKFVAFLVNIFGGNIETYESLIDRARREAILRMKAEAKGASEIINVRLETSSISQNTKNSIGAVEVLAYGTAIYR